VEVPRDDRQIKAAEASRRTGVVEVMAQEEGAATLHHAVGVNPRQRRACLLYSSRPKHQAAMSSSPPATINNTSGLGLLCHSLSLSSSSMAFACSYPIYADHPSVHQQSCLQKRPTGVVGWKSRSIWLLL